MDWYGNDPNCLDGLKVQAGGNLQKTLDINRNVGSSNFTLVFTLDSGDQLNPRWNQADATGRESDVAKINRVMNEFDKNNPAVAAARLLLTEKQERVLAQFEKEAEKKDPDEQELLRLAKEVLPDRYDPAPDAREFVISGRYQCKVSFGEKSENTAYVVLSKVISKV